MESSRSCSKTKVPKVKALNENVSPMQMEMDDQRARYLQSMTMSPRLQLYSENIDVGSPLGRYSGKAQPYCGNSSGNSSFSSRGRLSLSPLSSVENFDIAPPMSPPMYGTPVKVDEEVLVMDDILVRSMGGKNGRSSSSSSGRGSSSSSSSPSPWLKSSWKTEVCKAWDESGNRRYNSKCQFAHGKELHPSRLSMMSISKAQAYNSPMSAGSCIYGSNSCTVHQHHGAAEYAVTTSQPASPVKPEPHHAPCMANSNTFRDWSPLDDGIEVVLPGLDKSPSREEVEAYISSLLIGLIAKRRLPVFQKLCEGQ